MHDAMERQRLVLALLGIAVLAAILRIPGIRWGFDLEPGVYHSFHPDEDHSCTNAMVYGLAWLDDPKNWTERGVQIPCYWLSRLSGGDMEEGRAVLWARGVAVLAGLLGVGAAFLLGRRLWRSDQAGLWSAFFLATSGLHLVSSFFARGDAQGTLFQMLAVFCAVVAVTEPRAARWLFWAGAATGAAIAGRFYVSLLPLLGFAAFCSKPRTLWLVALRFGAAVTGTLLGFAAITGLRWSPTQVWNYLTHQRRVLQQSVGVEPIWIYLAALLALLMAVGLPTLLFALGKLAAWGQKVWVGDSRGRRERLGDAIFSPTAVFLLPFAVQFLLIGNLKLFDARYVNGLVPACVILAGGAAAACATRRAGRALLVVALAWQVVYATGILLRYVDDPRARMLADLPNVLESGDRVALSRYIPETRALARSATPRREDATVHIVSELHAQRFVRRPAGFSFLDQPRSCGEIRSCKSPEEFSYFRWLISDPSFTKVAEYRATRLTPEMQLYAALLGPNWVHSSDVKVLRRSGP